MSITDKKRMAISTKPDYSAELEINGQTLVMWVNVGPGGNERLVICPESRTPLTIQPMHGMIVVSV